MNADRFDELMRDAAETFHRPSAPPLDAMWREIESAHFGGGANAAPAPGSNGRHRHQWWLGIAATLIVGVALGRYSATVGHERGVAVSKTAQVATIAPTVHVDTSLAVPYDVETSKYLGQTAALLVALPDQMHDGRAADQQFVARAGELLTRTRLLLDSPAASDPSMRTLLEDLELVLAQIVQLQHHQSRTELDLINQALEQRDVIPRLRTAVADISAN